jgi:hypothetical protein
VTGKHRHPVPKKRKAKKNVPTNGRHSKRVRGNQKVPVPVAVSQESSHVENLKKRKAEKDVPTNGRRNKRVRGKQKVPVPVLSQESNHPHLITTVHGPLEFRDPDVLYELVDKLEYRIQKLRLIVQPDQICLGAAGVGLYKAFTEFVTSLLDPGMLLNVMRVWSPAYEALKGTQEAHSDTGANRIRFVFGVTKGGVPRIIKHTTEHGTVSHSIQSGGMYVMDGPGSGAARVREGADLYTHQPMAVGESSMVLILDAYVPLEEQAAFMNAIQNSLKKLDDAQTGDVKPASFPKLEKAVNFKTEVVDKSGNYNMHINTYWKYVREGKIVHEHNISETEMVSRACSASGGGWAVHKDTGVVISGTEYRKLSENEQKEQYKDYVEGGGK